MRLHGKDEFQEQVLVLRSVKKILDRNNRFISAESEVGKGYNEASLFAGRK